MRRRLTSPLLGLVIVAGLAAPVFAQGNGNGRPKAPRTTPATPVTPGATPAVPPASGTDSAGVAGSVSFRQFGAWLDDASAVAAGDGSISIGMGYWRLDGVSQTNAPTIGAGVGVTDRLQVTANVPFYRISGVGRSASGLDDVYLGAKYTVLDPTLTLTEVGLAVSPVVEILSPGAPGGRVHFVLPVSLELRRAPFRAYGSAGYFTRGAVFTGAALEWTSPASLVLTGAFTQSYAISDNTVLDSLAVARQRADVTLSAAYPIATRAMAYGSVGRSLASAADGGTSLSLTAGVAVGFRVRPTVP